MNLAIRLRVVEELAVPQLAYHFTKISNKILEIAYILKNNKQIITAIHLPNILLKIQWISSYLQ